MITLSNADDNVIINWAIIFAEEGMKVGKWSAVVERQNFASLSCEGWRPEIRIPVRLYNRVRSLVYPAYRKLMTESERYLTKVSIQAGAVPGNCLQISV